MLDVLTRLFTSRDDSEPLAMEPRLAVAALLVHLAAVDGVSSPAEREAVRGILIDHYDISETEVDRLIAEAHQHDAESVDFYRFTSAIANLPNDEKIAIVRMMWQVVFSDGRNHELEDNMVWRIAELIHVSARDRTVLRQQMARR